MCSVCDYNSFLIIALLILLFFLKKGHLVHIIGIYTYIIYLFRYIEIMKLPIGEALDLRTYFWSSVC